MVCPHNGILLGNKKEWHTDTCHNMSNERSQSESTTYCMTSFILNVQNGQIYRDKKNISYYLHGGGSMRCGYLGMLAKGNGFLLE